MKALLIVLSIVSTGLMTQAFEIITPGPAVSVGAGQARSFIRTDSQGNPRALGLWLTAKALKDLPAHDHIYELPLPTAVNLAPYNHVTVDWNPHGHIPEGIYNVPHFDFHFYFITPAERALITCQDTDRAICLKQPEAQQIPPNYAATPEGLPKMGWHWVDITSPEFNGQSFTTTFIYGYYNGLMNFIEPMVALQFLTPRVLFERDLSRPAKYPLKGYYPGRYSVFYSSPMDAYWISLEKLDWFE